MLIAIAAAAFVGIAIFLGMRPSVAGTSIVLLAPLVPYVVL